MYTPLLFCVYMWPAPSDQMKKREQSYFEEKRSLNVPLVLFLFITLFYL